MIRFRSSFWMTVAAVALMPSVAGAEAVSVEAQEGLLRSSAPLEMVVVTAQRREQSLHDVPMSLSVLSGDALEQAGVSNVAGLQQVVPGFKMSFAGAHAQPTIRGVGTQVAGVGLPSNVAIYVDGAYRPNAISNNVSFIDIESVQVLKGPQGTLYGRNATGGAVLVSTRDPSEAAELELKASYRSYGEARLALYGSTPISDDLAASISLFGSYSDGHYNDNVVPGVSDVDMRSRGIRAKFQYLPTDVLDLTLTVEHTEIRNPNTFAYTNYRGRSVGALFPGTIVTSKPRDYSNDYKPKFESDATGVFLKAEYQFPLASLTSVSSAEWQDNLSGYDVDGSSMAIQHVDFPGEQRTFSQSFDIASELDGPLSWVSGLFLMHDKGEQTMILVSPPGPFEIINGYVRTRSLAVYGDVTYQIAPRLDITAGLRYSKDLLDLAFAAPGDPATRANTSFSSTTPRAVLRYELNDWSNVYVSYSEGYKSGGYNMPGATTVPVKQEEIKAYEIGYKGVFGVWDVQASAFYYDYTNLQVSAYEGPVTMLVNAAEGDIRGAELQISSRPRDGLFLDLAIAYVDGEYDSFPAAPHYTWDSVSGISVAPEDASGNPIVNAPRFSGRLGVNYNTPLASGMMESNVNYSYQTTTYFDAFKETEQGSYGVLNLSVGWTPPSDAWRARMFVENVTDKDYATSIFQQPVAFSAVYAPPRTYGVEFSVYR